MKRIVWLGAVGVVLALAAGATLLVMTHTENAAPVAATHSAPTATSSPPLLSFNTSVCREGGEIDPALRAEVDAAALAFVNLFAQSPAGAREQMSTRGKTDAPAAAAMESLAGAYRAMGDGPRSVVESYVIESKATAPSNSLAPCGERAGDDSQTFVMRGATPLNAVVLMTDEQPMAGQRTTSVWLENEDGQWRARGLHFTTTRMAGLDGRALWQMARAQRVLGHPFNAYLLYVVAGQLRSGGNMYQAGYVQRYREDAKQFTPPAFLQSSPPYSWTFKGETYALTDLRLSGVSAGVLAITLVRPPSAKTAAQTEADNRKLIKAFDAAYPEWRDIAGELAVAVREDGSETIRRTRFSRDTGFVNAPR